MKSNNYKQNRKQARLVVSLMFEESMDSLSSLFVIAQHIYKVKIEEFFLRKLRR